MSERMKAQREAQIIAERISAMPNHPAPTADPEQSLRDGIRLMMVAFKEWDAEGRPSA